MLGVEGAPVGHGERLVRDGVSDGAPHIDDADTSLQEAVGILAQMTMNTRNARIERLVDVDALL